MLEFKSSILYRIFRDYRRNNSQLTEHESLIGEHIQNACGEKLKDLVNKDLICPITQYNLRTC
ncbi:MAG: hypothetical protein QWI36_04335 [Wolbachia endosymbiont of Tyrophagus putrescentiae]|nr:hypothetical protein [Wolbachia endosymbiont of Tyrophagus putrescentiae]